MPPAEPELPLRHALALGLLQGPAELLPISSSAHTTLVSMLRGWPYARLAGGRRKSFELALHGGAALALAAGLRRSLACVARPRRAAAVLVAATAPPALAGLALRGPIERRLGGPRSIAAGLLAGALAMALADRVPGERSAAQAGVADGLALGAAQVLALAPGVSRSGATLAAARARRFDRSAASALCWGSGLPLMLAAAAFEAAGMRGRELDAATRGAMAAGAAAAFASGLVAARTFQALDGARMPLAPFAAYRMALGAVLLRGGTERSQ